MTMGLDDQEDGIVALRVHRSCGRVIAYTCFVRVDGA
jgi:hypothetical protein